MSNLTGTVGIIAIAAGVVAVIALLSALALSLSLRRIRAAQHAVLGDGNQDLVAHAATLQASFESLAQYVEDVSARLESRMNHAESRLNGAIAHRALVRYDAYGEMSGRQSTSIALLDATQTGVVLSSIHHRDTARLYVKQVIAGKPELELSPEEKEAVRLALSTGQSAETGDPPANDQPGSGAPQPAGRPVD